MAVASPIIIHLLSKRKFKILNWAAMDFLLEAEKRNRKRVKMENLLLLLLRCLAILLIAALVARPFFKAEGIGTLVTQGASYERIVILDNSPSMTLKTEGKITFDETRDVMIDFIRNLARDRSGDTISVYLTSEPGEPLAKGVQLTEKDSESLITKIQQLKPSDLPAQLEPSLLAINDVVTEGTGKINHVVYLISDMRRHDWLKPKADDQATDGNDDEGAIDNVNASSQDGSTTGDKKEVTDKEPIVEAIQSLADKTQDFIIVDVGSVAKDNLAVLGLTTNTKSMGQRHPRRV